MGGYLGSKKTGSSPFTNGLFEAECAMSPFVYVDVGARGGTDRRWKRFKKHFLTVAFEADEAAYQELLSTSKRDPKVRPIFAALHNRSGEITFYVTRKAAVSSVLPPNREFLERFPDPGRFDVVRTVRLEATTLDSALQTHGISGRPAGTGEVPTRLPSTGERDGRYGADGLLKTVTDMVAGEALRLLLPPVFCLLTSWVVE